MRLGLMGGTFDPIHLGHLILAEIAREQLALERVLFMPAGDPYRKAGRDIAASTDRLAMTRLAVRGNGAFEVDDRETRRKGPTYTVDSLRELHAERPGVELFFLVGEDALTDMAYWKDPPGIAALATIAVAPRQDASTPAQLPVPAERILRLEMPYIGINSTDLRERARRGASLRYQTPDTVEAYIRERGLYRELETRNQGPGTGKL
jgi:nicotinate-nucleotide adenylyltransferase